MLGRLVAGDGLPSGVVGFILPPVSVPLFFKDQALPALQPLSKFGEQFAIQITYLRREGLQLASPFGDDGANRFVTFKLHLMKRTGKPPVDRERGNSPVSFNQPIQRSYAILEIIRWPPHQQVITRRRAKHIRQVPRQDTE